MSESGPAVKAALVTLFGTLYPDALASYGVPGAFQPDEIAAVMDQRFEVSRPTMGTGRSREEAVETVVVFSVFVSGDESSQRVATERAYAMCLALDEHFRTGPQETLGGSCREAWVTSGELAESVVTPPPGGGSGVTGRVAELSVTVTSRHRR